LLNKMVKNERLEEIDAMDVQYGDFTIFGQSKKNYHIIQGKYDSGEIIAEKSFKKRNWFSRLFVEETSSENGYNLNVKVAHIMYCGEYIRKHYKKIALRPEFPTQSF